GVGPGSSRLDYAAVGLDFEERWKRLDDAVMALRALWSGSEHGGHYYSTEGFDLAPRPAREGGPPIWIGSWGSEAGLRRTARLADGWLASAYNTTPSHFQESWQRLREMLPSAGKEPEGYPNALATMWTFVTESREEQQRFLSDVLGRMLNRDPLDLAQRIAVGPAEECAERLREYRDAGVQQVLIWPVGDPVRQLERFKKDVEPLVSK
ncbi:MAG TPA: LLM class flavin-dependent oxidoreductase, partial [Dehalococcoidia bacterium]|nr:LLM class flavin-dependent oxidoreductase [Dehalococcoidia bacterium]